MMIAIAGGALTLASATLLYLASPNQPFRSRAVRPRTLALSGSIGLALGLVFILQWAGPATSVFIALTLAMLVWTILPLVAAVWRKAPGYTK